MLSPKPSLISARRFVPVNLTNGDITQAALAWHRAEFDVHPAREDGARISAPHISGARTEADVLRVFARNQNLAGLRMAVNLPADVVVIRVRPEGGERWQDAIKRLHFKYGEGKVLFECPCHQISNQSGAYLWLTIPEPLAVVQLWLQDRTHILVNDALIYVPPAGKPLSTKASWLRPPGGPRWEIPPCPQVLWEAIQARIAELATAPDEDSGM